MSKKDNQYTGKFFEQAIFSIVNNLSMPSDEHLDNKTVKKIYLDAQDFVKQVKWNNCQWTGLEYKNAKGDFIVDDNIIEVKYVGTGQGTYFNTSMCYLWNTLNFQNYLNLLEKSNIAQDLIDLGFNFNFNNSSPVNMETSKNIRHNYSDIYNSYAKKEKQKRAEYIHDLYIFLQNDPEKLFSFINFMIGKGDKGIPDILIVYNYNKHSIQIISKNEIMRKQSNLNFNCTNGGLVFDNFRVAIGWQNGNGLNNPTLRVFLK